MHIYHCKNSHVRTRNECVLIDCPEKNTGYMCAKLAELEKVKHATHPNVHARILYFRKRIRGLLQATALISNDKQHCCTTRLRHLIG